MHKNDVFSVLFDNKKTHLQIVQRAADILRLLLIEDKLTIELTEMFWNLSKSDYKPEVYKIVNEGAPLLKQEHIDYISQQIQSIPAEKVTLEELGCLGELGKYSIDQDFKDRVTTYFWKVVSNSDLYKDDLVQNAIAKFAEIGKKMDLQKKHEYFLFLTKNLEKKQSSIPSLRLFKQLIKDHLDAGKSNEYSVQIYGNSLMGSFPIQPQPSQGDNNEEQKIDENKEPEFKLEDSLNKLINSNQLIEILIDNFAEYTVKAQAAIEKGSI
mmetsp:Transcript_44056/g.42658  ORF Transcript_44056/g.42658 Transcript_44056/m.42658 type:complete len:268 (+) Transcript_44056:1508-2311(+)